MLLGRCNATRSEISAALITLKESGSIDYAMNKAFGFVDEGKAALVCASGFGSKEDAY